LTCAWWAEYELGPRSSPTFELVITAVELFFATWLRLFFVQKLKKWTTIFSLRLIAPMVGTAATRIGRVPSFAPNIVLVFCAAIVATARKNCFKINRN